MGSGNVSKKGREDLSGVDFDLLRRFFKLNFFKLKLIVYQQYLLSASQRVSQN